MADILIRGMEMPKTCGDCPLSALRMDCKLTGKDISHDWLKRKIPGWCPLVPLPEGHGRLIDADAFLATIRPLCTEDAQAACTLETVKQLMVKHISSAPTIVPAEGGGEDG